MLIAHLQWVGLESPPAGLQLANHPQMLMLKAAIAPFAHAEIQEDIGPLRSEV